MLLRSRSRPLAQPWPGGYEEKDRVFFTGTSRTLPGGDKLVHGQQGEVVGPAKGTLKGKGVRVRFSDHKKRVQCELATVRRHSAASTATPPPPPRQRQAYMVCPINC